MSGRKIILPLNENIQFSPTDIPKDIDNKTKLYLEDLVKYSNNELKEFRIFLLENSSCENCFCWFCAFTIIGTIPFCIWRCRKKSDKIEMNGKIHDILDLILKNIHKKLTEAVILLKLKKVDNIDDNVNTNWYYEIELKKPITIPFDKPSVELPTYRDQITMKQDQKPILLPVDIEKAETRNHYEEGIQNGQYNPNDIQNYQIGKYEPSPIVGSQQPLVINQQPQPIYNQGNYMMNNQLNPQTNINNNYQPNMVLNQGMNVNNQNVYQQLNYVQQQHY